MQPLVDSALMETTWRTIGGAAAGEMRRMQQQCGKDQEELTGFVLGFTSDLGSEASGLLLYVQLVVAQSFRRGGAKFRKIKPGAIMRAWQANFAAIEELKASGHERAPFAFPPTLTAEPTVMQYVVDALTEADESDPITMTDEQYWQMLQVLKTSCDCMHDAAKGT